MVKLEKHILPNGLRVILHEDTTTPMVAVNVVYDVGSRDESPDRTGFAHLFEHLMFGGSANVPDFDIPIQMAGGENNAFTNSDMTSFYNVVPAANVETPLWLESDRMQSLTISEEALSVQQKVVVEEFKETCLNEPYGDLMHHITSLAYTVHPYRWPTIGLVPEHISEATLADVQAFYDKHYHPANAVLVIAGNIPADRSLALAQKWFGDIDGPQQPTRALPKEGKHTYQRKLVQSTVPLPAIYRAYGMVPRLHDDYYAYDLLSDVLGNGRSSRLYQRLHKEQNLFSVIDSYISGSFDAGLFMLEGQPLPHVSADQARAAILAELHDMQTTPILESELQKLKNKVEASLEYAEVSILHKAQSMAYFELLGDANLINQESSSYQAVTSEDILRVANELFEEDNCSEVVYEPVT